MLRHGWIPLLTLLACTSEPPAAGGGGEAASCSAQRPCAEGFDCIEGRCVEETRTPEPLTWLPTEGPEGLGLLSALLVDEERIFLGGYGSIAVSADGGSTWRESEPLARVEEFVQAGSAVFARTIDGVLSVTRDGGNGWNAPVVPLTVSSVHADGTTVYVVGFDGTGSFSFLRGSNGGLSWEAIPDLLPSHLAVGEGWLVVQAQDGRLLRSEDRGTTWEELSDPPFTSAGSDVVLQAWGEAVVALTDRPLQAFVSLDRGATWSSQVLDDASFASQRWLLPAADGLFAVTNGGAFHRLATPDGSWQEVEEGLPAGAFVEAASGGSAGAWVAYQGMLYRFDPATSAWAPGSFRAVRTTVDAVAVDGETVWALVEGKIVHRSDDGGKSWERVASPGADVLAIRSIAAGDGKVWIGTWYHGVFRSDDGGASWIALDSFPSMIGQPGVQPWGVEDLLYSEGTLYAGTWAMVSMGGDDGNFAYAGIGLARSGDFGASWTIGDGGLPSIGRDSRGETLRDGVNRIVKADGKLFLSTYGSGLFRSSDDGATWEPASSGLPGGVLDATAFLVDLVEQDGVLFAAVGVARDTASGVVESRDGGLTWRAPASVPPGACSARALARVGDHLVLSWDRFGEIEANEGIWVSSDGAGTWERLGTGQPALPADNLTATGDAILAGTERNGVWRLPTGLLE